jgi:dipeptidyl aminopeptidase/acylaminoacyl peptidase
MATKKKRRITADDLYRFQVIEDFHVSPDGRYAIYSLNWVDGVSERKFANLWIVPTAGGRPRQFTFGEQVDKHPRWSPQGDEITFLSNRLDDYQFQIYKIPFIGGEAYPVTDFKGEFNSYSWSPDGKQWVMQFRKKDADVLTRAADKNKEALGIVSHHIRRVLYKSDNYGYLPQERWHIWTVDARSGKGTQLTDGEIFDEVEPSWSPDGQKIVFLSNRSSDPDFNPHAVDIYVISPSGGEMSRIATPTGRKMLPNFSPDGGQIAYLCRKGRGDWWKNFNVWVVPTDSLDEPERARDLTGPFDFECSSSTLNDMGDPVQMPPTWSPNGDRIFFQVSRHGNTELLSITPDGENLETVIDRPGVVSVFHLDQTGEKLVYLLKTQADIGQIHVLSMTSDRERQLTRVNQNLLRAIDLGGIEEVWFKGSADNDLQGWILKPPGFDARKKYPAILEIHGGPLAQYGNIFMHEFYYLAAQDYVVFFSNPRGGQGYGEAHAKAIWNSWGSADYEDLMAWSDFMADQPYIDGKRMGVTGGSYGGYMTNWIIGHTDRFKAAVTQRSLSNLTSFLGSGDLNWMFREVFDDVPLWENIENYWRMSPIKYFGNAKTPTLVIHSEQDLRCPIDQGEQVFVALQQLGVESEMVLFPEEPHGLSRTGRTDRRIVRLGHIHRWFDRYLKGSHRGK